MRTAILAGLLLAPWPAAAQPVMLFDSQSVQGSGLTPGGDAVWLSVAQETEDYATRLESHDQLVSDEDGDGQVTLALGEPAPKSIWILVDVATGAYAVSTPSEAQWPTAQFSPAAATEAGDEMVVPERDLVELLVVRPGGGAWKMRAVDGGPEDADGLQDRNITVEASDLAAVAAGAEKTQTFAPGDLVVAIDLLLLEVLVGNLSEEGL